MPFAIPVRALPAAGLLNKERIQDIGCLACLPACLSLGAHACMLCVMFGLVTPDFVVVLPCVRRSGSSRMAELLPYFNRSVVVLP